MKPGKFQHFTEKEFHLNYWASLQKGTARKKREIPVSHLFKAGVYQPVFGKGSVLQLDQFLRTAEAKDLIGSSREMVASDTTLMRVLAGWDQDRLRQTGYGIHLQLRSQGQVSTVLSTGRKTQLGVVDGTCLGGHWYSVLSYVGGIYHGVDCERSKGQGHELATSRRLLKRAKEQIGAGFASHVLYDGLMADRIDLRLLRKLKSHLVVKTREETLEVIKSSKEVWTKLTRKELERVGVEMISGLDETRNVRYEVYAQGEIHWEGLKEPLKLAWVRETHLKGRFKGETLSFWVITTDESLTAVELREMAHARWAIENNGFKELSQQVGSKKGYIKNQKVKDVLVLMWMIGMTLLKTFQQKLAQCDEWLRWTVRKTKRLLAQVILSSVVNEVPVSGASP